MARRYNAVFMRGGTSKALVFHARDLPADRDEWAAIFMSAMGSPDPNGRQLDGMGGGVTSVSKVCVVGPPSHDDADVDYSFFQVHPREGRVLTHGNCGNMSAAIGPFAVDEGLVSAAGDICTVRIHNTNTRKIIISTFPLADGKSAVDGDLAIPGVTGTGAPVRLDFVRPGGASTGRLLPTGRPLDLLTVEGVGEIEVSIVDAANCCVFVAASSVGLVGTELPEALERDTPTLVRLRAVGVEAVWRCGLADSREAAAKRLPLIAVVSLPQDAPTLSGVVIPADDADICIRMLSSGLPHRALPVTGSVCTAVAMGITGTIPSRMSSGLSGGPRRIAMPSGVISVDADIRGAGPEIEAVSGSVYRTARRLFDGGVYAR